MGINSILIISNIRCGGTNLLKSLASYYNCSYIFEPNVIKDFNKDLVIKVNAGQHPLTELVNYASKFSRVILLDRKDKLSQIQSATWMFTNRRSVTKWEWNETLEGTDSHSKAIREVNYHTKQLKKLSKTLNIDISFYEDIYFGNNNIEGFIPIKGGKLRQTVKNKHLY